MIAKYQVICRMVLISVNRWSLLFKTNKKILEGIYSNSLKNFNLKWNLICISAKSSVSFMGNLKCLVPSNAGII